MISKETMATLRRLALDAGTRIMEIYDGGDLDVRAKDDASPVTAADEAADAVIAAGLRDAFPEAPVVTEEQAATHDIEARSFFIVDPLDGTKEFVARRGEFTVNIAWVEEGTPRLGVIYAPAVKRLFWTTGDGGAVEERGPFDPDVVGATVPLRAATPDGKLSVVASKSHRSPELEDYIARYDVGDSRSAGSSLKFCLVATGEAHFYPRLGPTMEWDTAAGDAILRAAGGRVVRADDHEPLAYGKPGFRNPHFIAHAPDVALAPLG